GLLGIWSAAEAGYSIPPGYWHEVENYWMKEQGADGSWGYRGGSGSLAMTVAGVASLFVAHDYIEPAQFGDQVGRSPFSPQLAHGINWLESGEGLAKGAASGYANYGIERTGLASGFKQFGDHDWYREIARDLLARQ